MAPKELPDRGRGEGEVMCEVPSAELICDGNSGGYKQVAPKGLPDRGREVRTR